MRMNSARRRNGATARISERDLAGPERRNHRQSSQLFHVLEPADRSSQAACRPAHPLIAPCQRFPEIKQRLRGLCGGAEQGRAHAVPSLVGETSAAGRHPTDDVQVSPQTANAQVMHLRAASRVRS